MHKFVTLVCHKTQAFTDSEILALIPADVLAGIKAKDPHPFFQAYSICHEGVSTPTLIGDVAKPIQWTRKAIQSIKNVITKGIKFFKGHNSDNSTTGRKELGEIVHSFEKEIDGVLHHVAISYHSPEVKNEAKQYDICSQEAEWNFFDAFGGMVADTVDKITGIALGSSITEQPAFAGARRIGLVQAFAMENGDLKNKGEPMTFDELKAEIKKLNVWPSQLYNLEEIKEDRKFAPVFTEVETLKNQVKEKDDKIKGLETEKTDLNRQSQQLTAKQRLVSLIEKGEIKLTDNQKIYAKGITDNFEKFGKSLADYSDETLKTFINQKISDDYPLIAAFTGTVDPIINNQQGNQNNNSGQSATDNKDDFTKASNNQLLDEDL